VSTGQLTGPLGRIRLQGTSTLANAEAAGVKALSADLTYDATIPTDAPENAAGTIEGHISAIEAFGEQIAEANGKASYDACRITTDVKLQRDNLQAKVTGTFQLHAAEKRLDLLDLTLGIQRSTWALASGETRPYLFWNDRGLGVSSLALVDQAATGQRLELN